MLTNDELDLARAKAIAAAKYAWVDAIEIRWGMLSASIRESFIDQACAIPIADAALGVVSVPVVATAEMIQAGGYQIERPTVNMGGPNPGSKYRATEVYRAIISASPYRSTPDA